MKFSSFILSLGLCVGLLGTAHGQNRASSYPDGGELMDLLRASLPRVPLKIAAELRVQNTRGDITRILLADILVDWGVAEPSAQYLIRDRFGSNREQLNITWSLDGRPSYEYFKGDDLEEAPMPRLDTPLDGLEITWTDLSLSFLWWPGAKTVGTDRVRGRFCYIVEIPAPEDQQGAYAGVRLWIDPETSLLLQADALAGRDRLARRLQVKSLKKIDEVWMVQNLDMYSYPSRLKTTLRVRKLETLDGTILDESNDED